MNEPSELDKMLIEAHEEFEYELKKLRWLLQLPVVHSKLLSLLLLVAKKHEDCLLDHGEAIWYQMSTEQQQLLEQRRQGGGEMRRGDGLIRMIDTTIEDQAAGFPPVICESVTRP